MDYSTPRVNRLTRDILVGQLKVWIPLTHAQWIQVITVAQRSQSLHVDDIVQRRSAKSVEAFYKVVKLKEREDGSVSLIMMVGYGKDHDIIYVPFDQFWTRFEIVWNNPDLSQYA